MGTLIPLDCLQGGECAILAEVDGDHQFVCRLEELGLRFGSEIRMVRPGSPCLLELESNCRLCLRGESTSRIWVRPTAGAVHS
jgi:ferrous iron transport protein A